MTEGEKPKFIEDERGRFLRAPVVIGVISSAREMHKIPVWEQELSAGAVCQNILVAAHALGFVANWITEWYAYHPKAAEKFGLKPGAERVAGFIYIYSRPASCWKNGPGRSWRRSSPTFRNRRSENWRR